MKRESEKRKYASAKKWAEKQGQSQFSKHLQLPDKVAMFKPKEGTMLLDVLPYVAGKGNPNADEGNYYWTRVYYVHRGIGANQEMAICLAKTTNKPCPVCEYRLKLMKKVSEDNEEQIKDLLPKERQLINVINLKEPDKGVQLWDVATFLFGKTLASGILSADEDEDWESFFHLDGGMTLKVTFGEESFGGRSFCKADSIYFKPRKDYDEDILESVLNLDELLVPLKYDALKKLFLEAETGEDEDETEVDDEDEKPKKKKKPVEEEDDDDDWDEDEEEEDEDEKPKKKKKPVVDDDEEEDGDGSEDEDEDEEPAQKKKKSTPVDDDNDWDEEKPKKKKKPVVDDDEEDEEEERPRVKTKDEVEEEDEEEEKPKKKNKKPVDEEEEDEEDDDDDWDEPAPKKKKK